MGKARVISESELGALAKAQRESANVTRAQAARDLGVSFASLHQAEEDPTRSLTELRRRIIERYSHFKVVGPEFRLEKREK
jgi:hypothetical protein